MRDVLNETGFLEGKGRYTMIVVTCFRGTIEGDIPSETSGGVPTITWIIRSLCEVVSRLLRVSSQLMAWGWEGLSLVLHIPVASGQT